MRERNPCLLTFLFAIALASYAYAKDAPQWQFVDADDGIRTWKLELPDQDLPGFRGQAMIEANAETILKVMLDHKSHTKWMYRCAESRVLEKLDEQRAILYNRTSAPWPVWDRDVVVLSTISKSDDGRSVDVKFSNVDSQLKKVPEGVIRMPRLVGFYKLREKAPGRTEVTYQIESDIGGSIPGWLARRAAKELPFVTLSRLRDRVAGKL
jgi:hypothetical protein